MMKSFIDKYFSSKKIKILAAFGLILVLIVAGVVVAWFQSNNTSSGQNSTAVQTSAVRRGDLSNSISGTGKVISENVVSLAFSTPGKVEVLNVEVGSNVTKGMVLATLENIKPLELDVENKQLAVQVADKALSDLQANKVTKLAQALADQSSAGVAYDTAQKEVIGKGAPRCDKNVTEQYYYNYMYARHDYNLWHSYLIDGGTGYGTLYIQQRMTPYRKAMELNYANWKYCEGYTDLEKKQSEAALKLAESNFQKAKAAYEELVKNDGIDPIELAIAQATKKDADYQLSQSQKKLADATLIAPFDGVITKVNGIVGQTTDTSAFIEMADLNNQLIQTNIDETDIRNFKVGCDAAVTFSTIPDQTFQGIVTRVDPALVTSNNFNVAQGMVKLSDPLPDAIKKYSLGLDASVEITCHQAQNVLLVPVDALHQASDQSAFIYVLDQTGKSVKRNVEVGLTTSVYAEIRSGLQEGETVVLGQGKS